MFHAACIYCPGTRFSFLKNNIYSICLLRTFCTALGAELTAVFYSALRAEPVLTLGSCSTALRTEFSTVSGFTAGTVPAPLSGRTTGCPCRRSAGLWLLILGLLHLCLPHQIHGIGCGTVASRHLKSHKSCHSPGRVGSCRLHRICLCAHQSSACNGSISADCPCFLKSGNLFRTCFIYGYALQG